MDIFLQDAAYNEALAAFYRSSNEMSGMKQRLQKLIPTVIKHLVQREKDCLNVLGVGCGDGEIDLKIVEIIKAERVKHSRKVEIFERAVDPNQSQLDKFQSSQKYQSLVQDGGVNIAFSCATFGEYLSSCSKAETNAFDVVHFILSIFYMTDIEDCLINTMEHLIKDDGRILIVMTGEDVVSSSHHKQRQLWPDNVLFPAFEDVVNKIQGIAWKHSWKCNVETDEYAIDVAMVFDEQSHEGNLILDSFTHIKDFRCSVDRQQVDETIDLIRKYVAMEVDGKCLCKRIFNFLVISK